MMPKLSIEGTSKSPEILMDEEFGIIEIKGTSFMEESLDFYAPVMNWITDYICSPFDTTVNVELMYFNSASAKILLMIFKQLKMVRKKNFRLTINWRYSEDDQDILDSGMDFSTLCDLKFNFIEKSIAVS
jgi:hypothetical protein